MLFVSHLVIHELLHFVAYSWWSKCREKIKKERLLSQVHSEVAFKAAVTHKKINSVGSVILASWKSLSVEYEVLQITVTNPSIKVSCRHSPG